MPFDRHAFWKDPEHSGYPGPWIEHCKPDFYLDLVHVTRLWVETMRKYAKPEWSIVELGCGTGRILAGLYAAGFQHVSGLEINPRAVELGRERFPELKDVKIAIGPVEDAVIKLQPADVIITSGLLMHLPAEAAMPVIERIKQLARRLIVIVEGERDASFHAWPHDYQALFTSGDWAQVEAHSCEAYPPLPKTTIKRVFVRDYQENEPFLEAKPARKSDRKGKSDANPK